MATNGAIKVLSVNVSQPRTVSVGRSTVTTGIFKRPVSGPVAARVLNLDGDRQADLTVHGGVDKAVYVYSRANIGFWRQALGRDDLGPGTFGENLTVSSLADNEVFIGDRLEIGNALFQVTQPRVPCYKLGIALGRPDLPKRFHAEDRHGFYLRVVREGTLQAGDRVQLTREPDSVTITELLEIYRQRAGKPETLHRLAGLDALPESWKSWLAARVVVR